MPTLQTAFRSGRTHDNASEESAAKSNDDFPWVPIKLGMDRRKQRTHLILQYLGSTPLQQTPSVIIEVNGVEITETRVKDKQDGENFILNIFFTTESLSSEASFADATCEVGSDINHLTTLIVRITTF